jgi:hypothetical protein
VLTKLFVVTEDEPLLDDRAVQAITRRDHARVGLRELRHGDPFALELLCGLTEAPRVEDELAHVELPRLFRAPGRRGVGHLHPRGGARIGDVEAALASSRDSGCPPRNTYAGELHAVVESRTNMGYLRH